MDFLSSHGGRNFLTHFYLPQNASKDEMCGLILDEDKRELCLNLKPAQACLKVSLLFPPMSQLIKRINSY